MAEEIPRIDVVATVVYCGGQVLLVYNDIWGGFTLPMTRLRSWEPGLGVLSARWELAADAAMRNVAECLGQSSDRSPGLLGDVGGVRQSGRTGQGDPHNARRAMRTVGGAPIHRVPVGT